jgi:uncharacterized protein (TIGR02246 family)
VFYGQSRKESKMRKPWITVVAAVAAVALLAIGTPALSQEAFESAIRARSAQYVAAWNSGNADAAAAVYAEDGTHTYVFGLTHRGRAEIAAGLKELWAGPLKGTQITIESLSIRRLGGEVAIEEEAFTVSGLKAPDGSALATVKGLCLAVYRKVGQEWLGAAVQCMVPPAGAGSVPGGHSGRGE